jgi:hypothetical protein
MPDNLILENAHLMQMFLDEMAKHRRRVLFVMYCDEVNSSVVGTLSRSDIPKDRIPDILKALAANLDGGKSPIILLNK